MAAVMEIPTRRTQLRIAALLHDSCDFTHCTKDDQCPQFGSFVVNSAFLLGKIMPFISMEMFPVVRDDERAKIAEHIRAELVCCDIYSFIDSSTPEQFGLAEQEWAALGPHQVAERLGLPFHAICHWGGYAAALAEKGPRHD